MVSHNLKLWNFMRKQTIKAGLFLTQLLTRKCQTSWTTFQKKERTIASEKYIVITLTLYQHCVKSYFYLENCTQNLHGKFYASWQTYMDGFLSNRSMSFSKLVSCFSNMVFFFIFGTVSVSIGNSKNSLCNSAQLVFSPLKRHTHTHTS